MYWQRMSAHARWLALGVLVAGAALTVWTAGRDQAASPLDDEEVVDAAVPAADAPLQARAAVAFRRWQDPTGQISADLPAGWTIDGGLGPDRSLGQFRIQAESPDRRSLITLGHNWVSFMEAASGPYQPGPATVERFLLPDFLRQRGSTDARVVYRTRVQRVSMPTAIGMPIPFDSGTIAILMTDAQGRYSVATTFAETMYIPVPGTPGLWRLRLFATAVAPAEAQAQADVRAALDRANASLDLSKAFFDEWNQAAEHSRRQMQEYSRQMDQAFSGYLQSMRRASPGGTRRDTAEDWATMMRGGQYGEDPETGTRVWITNDQSNWWINDRGVVAGNETGAPPASNDNWRRLVPKGQ